MLSNVNRLQFGLGPLVVLIAAALLLLNVIQSGVAGMVGITGIGLVAASGKRRDRT